MDEQQRQYQSACGSIAASTTIIESTVRYLGIEVDDAVAIAEQIDVRFARAADMLCPSPSAESRGEGSMSFVAGVGGARLRASGANRNSPCHALRDIYF